jgi:hypothetical protein
MANFSPVPWYVRDSGVVGWSAVAAWTATTSKAPGALVRQTAPAVNNERVFVAITSTTQNTGGSEPTWTVTKGAVQATDGAVVWQECTGQPGVNGDLTNTPTWAQQHASSTTISIGLIIQDAAADCLFIAKTGTTIGTVEPTWNKPAGQTTTDNAVTWVSLGAPANFGGWAAPHARLANAFASNWGAAGHSFFIGLDHAETQSTSMTLASPGAVATPCFIYSIPTATIPPTTPTSGASITSTATGTSMSVTGAAYYFGVAINAGSSTNTGTIQFSGNTWQRYDSCAIARKGTGNNNIFIASALRIDLVNTTLQFDNTSDTLQFTGNNRMTWRNTPSAIAGATIPTTLFNPSTTNACTVVAEGVDLSALGSGRLVNSTNTNGNHNFYFIDCKFGSGAVLSSGTADPSGPRVDAIRCASSAIIYGQSRFWYEGTLDPETTIVRTGGATDGTQPISWKIVTTANSSWVHPFEAFPISIWNSTVDPTSVTVTVFGIWGGGAVPNNDDIWIDVEYLGSSGSPLASVVSGTKSSNLASGSPLSSDTSTWGAGSTTKFKMAVTLSSPKPQLGGYLRVYVKAAKLSSTFYIDPLPVLS